MARSFAEQSGGGLTLATSPGQGTTVTLWLPQAQVAGNMTEPAAMISWRVLLVDDDALVREVLSEQLTDHGFKVAALSDAEAALAWLDEHVPDLLVTDRSMPGMDGLMLIRAAQGRWPGLPAILLTGYAGDGVQAAEDRPYSVLRKPVSGAQLVERASAVLEMGGFSSRT